MNKALKKSFRVREIIIMQQLIESDNQLIYYIDQIWRTSLSISWLISFSRE